MTPSINAIGRKASTEILWFLFLSVFGDFLPMKHGIVIAVKMLNGGTAAIRAPYYLSYL